MNLVDDKVYKWELLLETKIEHVTLTSNITLLDGINSIKKGSLSKDLVKIYADNNMVISVSLELLYLSFNDKLNQSFKEFKFELLCAVLLLLLKENFYRFQPHMSFIFLNKNEAIIYKDNFNNFIENLASVATNNKLGGYYFMGPDSIMREFTEVDKVYILYDASGGPLNLSFFKLISITLNI